MNLVKAEQITFNYETQAENLFENISFEINTSDKIGLIGINGSGKSTLFALLQQEIFPQNGTINFKNDLKIGFLPQEVRIENKLSVYDYLWSSKPELFTLKKKIDNWEDFEQDEMVEYIAKYENKRGYSFENQFEKILAEFDFPPPFLKRDVASLSGGEKTKIAFCRLLLDEPDLLLLDEPTNHIDVSTLEWLENYLQNLKKPYIVISHDRTFLDECTREIWEIQNGQIQHFSGNYSFYKKQLEEEFERKLQQYNNAQKKIKKLKKAVTNRKSWAVTHQSQTGKEGYAPVYESVGNEAKKAMRQAKSVETRLIKKITQAEKDKPWIEKKRKLCFEEQELNLRYVLQVENLSKSYGENRILDNLSFSVSVQEKLAISGDNGSGKSTLLKILNGTIPDYEGTIKWNPQVKIGYYSQEFETLDFMKTILEEVIDGDFTKQVEARTVLGSLNIRREKVHDLIKTLSLGEKSKVVLAKLLLSGCNVLLLDEPTNHLEISSREAMEDALKQFPGAIIIVTHDRYLKKILMTREINL